jgi:hypothetical protein
VCVFDVCEGLLIVHTVLVRLDEDPAQLELV